MKVLRWLYVSALVSTHFASSLACADGWDGYVGDFPGVPPMEDWRPPHEQYVPHDWEVNKKIFQRAPMPKAPLTLPVPTPDPGKVDTHSPTSIPLLDAIPQGPRHRVDQPDFPPLRFPLEGIDAPPLPEIQILPPHIEIPQEHVTLHRTKIIQVIPDYRDMTHYLNLVP